MSKEIICLNIGQAGVQISNSCWELFCIEHGLDCYGNEKEIISAGDDQFRSNLNTFFHQSSKGNYVPRSISVDLESSVIDEIRTGPYRHLWNPDCLISGLEDAANNFGRGYISIGKTKIAGVMATLGKVIQECDKLHGLIFLHSYSGGTGSGFTNLILDSIKNEYAKTTNIASVVFPSPEQSTAVVEPYNCLLSAMTSLHNIDVALMSDNECLYELCLNKLMIQRPSYQNINRLLSQLYSSLTVTLRFRSSLDHDIVHLQTNLIPFPRIHFPISTFAPLGDQTTCDHESLSTQEMTHELFDQNNRFISCDVTQGKYMACCLHYRGLVKPRDINNALLEIKRRKDIDFVDWSPTGFKIGISPMPPASVAHCDLAATNKNCSMFFNSTAIEKIWDVIHKKFKALYNKKSFLHWFIGEGMEESEFLTCDDEICELQNDYKDIENQTDDWFQERFRMINPSDEVVEINAEMRENSSIASDTVDTVDGNTNNNLMVEEPSSRFSIIPKASSLYSIRKVSFQSSNFKSSDMLQKNRRLLKLFQKSSD